MDLKPPAAPVQPAWSLHHRLLRTITLAVLGLGLPGAAAILWLVVHSAAAQADVALERFGSLLLTVLEHEYAEQHGDVSDFAFLGAGPFEGLRIAVWNQDGRCVIGDGGQGFPRGSGPRTVGTVEREGAYWRVLTLRGPGNLLTLQVAEPADARLRASLRLGLLLGTVLLLLLGVVAYSVRAAARRVLVPVVQASHEIARRRPGDLRPLPGNALPAELAPLLESINAMLAQIEVAFQHERIFAATAAHELRTPLAAARLNAQFLGGGGAESAAAARDLVEAIDRTTRLLEQLSTLARIESGELAHDWSQGIALDRLVEEAFGQLRPLAQARGVRLSADVPADTVRAPLQAVYMLLRNLVENAVKYVPEGGRVEVRGRVDARGWTLEVADNGPGLDEQARARLAGHNRGLAPGDGSGRGLGLSIVWRLAAQLGARLNVGEGLDGRGVRIGLVFPGGPGAPAGS